jgi:hypothetical protein
MALPAKVTPESQPCTTLAPLSSLWALTQLQLRRLWELKSLHHLGGLTGLKDLYLEQCFSVTGISPLHCLTALQNLDLIAVGGSVDQQTVASMLPGLQRLTVRPCSPMFWGSEYRLPEWSEQV